MKKIYNSAAIVGLFVAITTSSCHKDLDLYPTNDNTPNKVYSTMEGYDQVMAKVYGAMALTGNSGPAGSGDVSGDEGFSDFVRIFWNLQELTTDEAIVAWSDPGLPDLHNHSYTSINPFIRQLYRRCLFHITFINEFLRESSDSKLAERGFSTEEVGKIKLYKNEARFIRAFQYWALMDLYGNVPFITEDDKIGTILPRQGKRSEIFAFIENELKSIENELLQPRSNLYGRVDKAAVWSLLARLYLNSEVYIGVNRYEDALTYSKKVIDAGYSLHNDYTQLMLADNNRLAATEIIFAVPYDGLKSKNYGGTTFLVNASIGPPMKAADYGMSGTGWAGLRTTKNLIGLFKDNGFAVDSSNFDYRAQFFKTGSNLDINLVSSFTDGYKVIKYRNVKSDGNRGSNFGEAFSDIDFPLFRLPEMYLIYAECVTRGATNGDLGTAITYVNELRKRAYRNEKFGNSNGQVETITKDFILDERARELYWEGHRRTDLIRFGKFSSVDYLWPFKGGQRDGVAIGSYLELFPIPSDDLVSNPKLVQNPGY
jgi:hypothetical protein